MVGNFCWVLIFVTFMIDLAVMKISIHEITYHMAKAVKKNMICRTLTQVNQQCLV